MDIRLITILPPQPTIAQPSVVQQPTTQGSAILAQLPTGSILSGFIINRDGAGNPILRTEKGDVLFNTNLFLKIGAEVVIRTQTHGNKVTAHIVSVDGRPPELLATQQTNTREQQDVIINRQNQPNAANITTQPSKLPPVGTTLSAIITTPTFNAQVPNLPELPPGTALLLTVLQSQQQTARGAPALNTLTTGAGVLLPEDVGLLPNASNVANTISTAAKTTTPQPTPTTITKLIAEHAAPVAFNNAQAAQANLVAPLGQSLVATLLPNTSNEPVTLLQTSLGVVRVAQAIDAPAGTQITLRITSVTSPNSYTVDLANTTPALPPAPLSQLAKQWVSLQQIMYILGGEESLSALLPNVPSVSQNNLQPASLGNQTLFFLAALKGGDFQGWLGHHAIKQLEDKGYGSLLRKAEGEFLTLARQFTEAPPSHWQSFFFPVAVGGEVQQVRAFVKRDKKKKSEGDEEDAEDTRFILEMDLSQLGALQMDGLVKRTADKLQFDLMVRSQAPLPPQLKNDIQTIFQDTADLTGYRGQILFQTTPHFPINPLEETLDQHLDDVIV